MFVKHNYKLFRIFSVCDEGRNCDG